MKLHHGGDTSWAKETFSYKGDDWLDLSTGINQCPYPIPEIPADAYHRLPEKLLLQSLKKAAASYYDMNDTAKLTAASGSQSLIQWVARLRAPGKTAILTPTYQEHAHSWIQAGHDVYEDTSLDRLLSHQPDVLVIVHPNNPTGLTLDEDELLALADRMDAKGGWLVLDEAFGDVIPDQCLGQICRTSRTDPVAIIREVFWPGWNQTRHCGGTRLHSLKIWNGPWAPGLCRVQRWKSP